MFYSSFSTKKYLLFLTLIYACLSIGKFVLPATDRDESRFAQASKQMVETGDCWSIKFLDQPRNKKPIGIYWVQAGFVKIAQFLGVKNAEIRISIYRLPNILAGFGMLLAMFFLFRGMIGEKPAAMATTFMAISLLTVVESFLAKTDTVLLMLVVIQQGLLARWYTAQLAGQRHNSFELSVMWIIMALAVLIKGPIAPVIFLLTILTLRFGFKADVKLRSLEWIKGVVILALVNVPWFAMVQWKSSGAYAAHAIGVDFIPKLLKGQESHGFYPGYYTLTAFILLWPGSLLVFRALPNWWGLRKNFMAQFFLAWLVPSWVMFEMIPTKLPHYVLPLIPAIWFLTALVWKRYHEVQETPTFVKFLAGFFAISTIGLFGFFPVLTFSEFLSVAWGFLVLAISVCLYLISSSGFGLRLSKRLVVGTVGFYVLAFTFFLPNTKFLWLSEVVYQARTLTNTLGKPLVVVGFNEPSLYFKNGTDTNVVTSTAEALNILDLRGGVAVIPASESQQDSVMFYDFKDKKFVESFTDNTQIKSLNYSRNKWQDYAFVKLKDGS
jgi:4-amino-4-deoxy-L-arabinose transferase-like glycosyltransferase